MKVFPAALAFLMPARASGGVLSSLFGGLHWRSLTSEQCLEETTDYFSDGSLMVAAFDAVNGEIADKASCSGVSPTVGRSTCTVDFDTFETTEQFVKACQYVYGGKAVEVNAEIECGYQPDITEIEKSLSQKGFTFKYDNLLDCVSLECDDESIKEKIEGEVAKAASKLESSLDVTCTYSTEGFYSFSSLFSDAGDGEDTKDDADLSVVIDETPPTWDITLPGDGASADDADAAPTTDEETEDVEEEEKSTSSGQCRTLMTAVVGLPLLNMALAA